MTLRLRTSRVHFIGIGGIGMSGIAELLHILGHKVTGSDLGDNDQIRKLRSLGVIIQKGHSDEILKNERPDVVVYSNAVKPDNSEWVYARSQEIPVIRRAEMLAELMRLKRGISVGGSHGKTTTTGMLSFILKESGRDPTVVIGGQFAAIGSNAAWGGGEWLVAEADESDGSFLHLAPEISVVTNIDFEHMDHYGGIEQLQKTFLDFIDRTPFYGRSVLCADSPLLLALRDQIRKPTRWYAFSKQKNCYQIELLEQGAFPAFHLLCPKGNLLFKTKLQVPGKHNVSNAVAAALVCLELGVSAEEISKSICRFQGVARRFEKRGLWKEHLLYEDYGHHPTEISATLEAAKSVYSKEKIVVVFQPHRFSRTKLLWEQFRDCFKQADIVVTLPIYAGGEAKTAEDESFDNENFLNNLHHTQKYFVKDFNSLKLFLEDYRTKESFGPVFFLGAGDITKAPKVFLES